MGAGNASIINILLNDVLFPFYPPHFQAVCFSYSPATCFLLNYKVFEERLFI